MAERYYLNSPLPPGRVLLQGAEAHHLAVVCRVRPGQQVLLFNGDGHEYHAEVIATSKKTVELDVRAGVPVDRELPFPLVVACPLPKGDRGQFLVEKLTELGVSEFVPLLTQRSVIHPSETRVEKLERYVIEASKQCGRNRLMAIRPPTPWQTLAVSGELPSRKWLAHPGGTNIPARPGPDGAGGLAIAVGPEGGFTDEEVALTRAAGWQVIDLGPRILRIETAAITLAALANRLATAASETPGQRAQNADPRGCG